MRPPVITQDWQLVCVPDADALVNATESLKDAESCVLNELSSARHQEEILIQHLHVYTGGTSEQGTLMEPTILSLVEGSSLSQRSNNTLKYYETSVPCREVVPISEVK